MTGRKRSDVEGWRNRAASLLEPVARVIDPARADYDVTVAFSKHQSISEAVERLRHGRFVVDRNKNLIRRCDVVLANLLGARTRVSIGSVGELYWADSFGKPIIVVREVYGNIHDHAMLNAIASEICPDLETACQIITKMVAACEVSASPT